ncbi:DNA (cytosine-5-)-methyltransferase [Mycoplasma struthionis]|uniref:Cytosine-specific methyltransferase n=1 Tax=Mycoplasma struthionis TaxID=538220 RepID=A0A3G8LG84_9MOLU|nr:DNA (cytosine-5-)-methyltransferase [Mycoplasma struthionis]AZG68646.1 DNA (cytosine-5-)-methyltransferase [Mycoplasma struthionis]TPI02300.1 DNA (cytosine-5-)-methyltransferase [Mycoplasma struthionis]
MKYKVGSLFAGIGGICRGFIEAEHNGSGFEIAWANEVDDYACETYKNNFKHPIYKGDIEQILDYQKSSDVDYYFNLYKNIAYEPLDILVGGFPCQAFSIAGQRKGFFDNRGNLFWSIVNLINLLNKNINKKPRALFLENVKNLVSHDNKRTFKVIKQELEKLGYVVKEKVLNTSEYSNLPQNRERIYIVCFLNNQDAENFSFDNLETYKNNFNLEKRKEQIKNLLTLDKKVDDKYYYDSEKYPKYFGELKDSINLNRDIDEYFQFFQLRRGMYVRKNKSNVCPTLTANMGTGGHNVPLIKDDYGIRKLTPDETLKLQGFNSDTWFKIPQSFNNKAYPDSQLYKQAGNAVSIPVIKLIANEILSAFSKTDLKDKIA